MQMSEDNQTAVVNYRGKWKRISHVAEWLERSACNTVSKSSKLFRCGYCEWTLNNEQVLGSQ